MESIDNFWGLLSLPVLTFNGKVTQTTHIVIGYDPCSIEVIPPSMCTFDEGTPLSIEEPLRATVSLEIGNRAQSGWAHKG